MSNRRCVYCFQKVENPAEDTGSKSFGGYLLALMAPTEQTNKTRTPQTIPSPAMILVLW